MNKRPTVTAQEAALRLHCSKRTVLRIIARGHLAAHKMTRAATSPYQIYVDDLDQYLTNRNHPPPKT